MLLLLALRDLIPGGFQNRGLAMRGKMDINKTFRTDEEFSAFLGRALMDTGLSLADLIRISLPIALPVVRKLCDATDSKSLAETVADAMLKSQQD
jgi:hypothetical protein